MKYLFSLLLIFSMVSCQFQELDIPQKDVPLLLTVSRIKICPENAIIFEGDSNTALIYPADRFFSNGFVVGLPGNRIIHAKNRMYYVKRLKPKVITIMMGTNNLPAIDQTFYDDYNCVLNFYKTIPSVEKIIVVSILPQTNKVSNAYIQSVNANIKQITLDNDCIFLDEFADFYDPINDRLREEYDYDGSHWTISGIKQHIENIKTILKI